MAGEDLGQIGARSLAGENRGEDVAVVIKDGEIAGAGELGGKVGPLDVDFSADNAAA